MNKNKFYTIGLIASALFATSCDDRVDCGCDCNQPKIESWEILKPNTEKNPDGTVNSGTAIVIYGSNLSEIVEISFNGLNAELQPAFMEDSKIVFQVPEGISEDCIAHVRTVSCDAGFDVDLLKVVVAPPCVAMCDNEMAEKTLKIAGNSFFAPLTAYFWDGSNHTIKASTEDGTIKIDNQNEATIVIPSGVADVTVDAVKANPDAGKIRFVSNAGESMSEFRFRDTRNMLITHDSEDLNIFNQNKPDAERVDEETGAVIGLPEPKETLKATKFLSENNTGEFSIFHDLAGYTAWTYGPEGEANTEGKEPEYETPFGVFQEEIKEGKDFYNYVVKFEVFVPKENPVKGNGIAVGFFANNIWTDIRAYCAYWTPSLAQFKIDKEKGETSEWTFQEWHSQGDWLTVAIPLEEFKYDLASANYKHCAHNNRMEDDEDVKYSGFGDKSEGIDYFAQTKIQKLAGKWPEGMCGSLAYLGFEMGNADQNITDNDVLIGVDNLRITPKDNNGGYWPMIMWGASSRDFYKNPIKSCK